MTMQLAGTMSRRMDKKPMMKQQDSSVKSALKEVMKLGRANKPKMPMPMKRAEGM